MDKPIVYVTQYMSKWDFTEAAKYGEVVFLTQSEYRPEPTPVGTNAAIAQEIREKFKDYRANIDYIVMTGSAIPNFVTGMLVAKWPGTHKLLKWSSRRNEYEMFLT